MPNAPASRPPASTPTPTPLPEVVDVLVDGAAARLGPLSYRVPAGMRLTPGTAVSVPFGTRSAYGFVLGSGDASRATREITARFGKRVTAAELDLVRTVADRHLCQVATIASRLAPRDGKSAPPLEAGPVRLVPRLPTIRTLAEVDPALRRRFLVCAPLVDQTLVAAREAARLCETDAEGQVLVLAPTVDHVERTLAHFASGAVRLDAAAPRGAWKGFAEGTARVGIGTRSAALYSAHRLAGVIVVEEEHPGHRERHQPHTHARDLAALRSRRFQAALVLIGSNPTPLGLGARVKVASVGGPLDWPRMDMIDRSTLPPEDRVLPPAMVASARRALEAGHSPIVVTDGRAARWVCQRCGAGREGPRSRRRTSLDLADPCSRCGQVRIRLVGWDAARVAAAFPPGCVAVPAAELVHRESAGLVIVPDLDGRLRTAALDPDGPIVQLVVTAARAAGRRGHLMAATSMASSPVLGDLFAGRDLTAVARRTWATAREHRLPPFERQVQILVGTTARPRLTGWPGTVLGPRSLRGEWEILVRIPDGELATLAPFVSRLRRRGKVRVTVS